MIKKFTSNALWPVKSRIFNEYGNNESKDYHYSKEVAQSVCDMLESHGCGGEGEIFPLKTWIGDNNEFSKISPSMDSEKNYYF